MSTTLLPKVPKAKIGIKKKTISAASLRPTKKEKPIAIKASINSSSTEILLAIKDVMMAKYKQGVSSFIRKRKERQEEKRRLREEEIEKKKKKKVSLGIFKTPTPIKNIFNSIGNFLLFLAGGVLFNKFFDLEKALEGIEKSLEWIGQGVQIFANLVGEFTNFIDSAVKGYDEWLQKVEDITGFDKKKIDKFLEDFKYVINGTIIACILTLRALPGFARRWWRNWRNKRLLNNNIKNIRQNQANMNQSRNTRLNQWRNTPINPRTTNVSGPGNVKGPGNFQNRLRQLRLNKIVQERITRIQPQSSRSSSSNFIPPQPPKGKFNWKSFLNRANPKNLKNINLKNVAKGGLVSILAGFVTGALKDSLMNSDANLKALGIAATEDEDKQRKMILKLIEDLENEKEWKKTGWFRLQQALGFVLDVGSFGTKDTRIGDRKIEYIHLILSKLEEQGINFREMDIDVPMNDDQYQQFIDSLDPKNIDTNDDSNITEDTTSDSGDLTSFLFPSDSSTSVSSGSDLSFFDMDYVGDKSFSELMGIDSYASYEGSTNWIYNIIQPIEK